MLRTDMFLCLIYCTFCADSIFEVHVECYTTHRPTGHANIFCRTCANVVLQLLIINAYIIELLVNTFLSNINEQTDDNIQ